VANYEWAYILLPAVAVAIAIVLLYATRMRKTKEKAVVEPPILPAEAWTKRFSLSTERTVTTEEAQEAKDRLKMFDLEREILSSAIRRLYEAQAEGKINEEEREKIAQRYKSRMMKVRDNMSKSESVVALHEFESMQDDLIKLFSERFDELGKKVEELRTRLEIKAAQEETPVPSVPTVTPSPSEATAPEKEKGKRRVRRRPAPAPSPKTEAEKRIDEIRAEVEKVLERLGQIEVEGET
jgi:hypothetical protein